MISIIIFASFSAFVGINQFNNRDPRFTQIIPCPPAHEESKKILIKFLSNENAQQNRQDFGIKKTTEDEIMILKNKTDKAACLKIQKKFPWKDNSGELTRTYYKTDNFYFIVNYSHRQKATEGIIMSGHGIVILSKEFEHLGAVLNVEGS